MRSLAAWLVTHGEGAVIQSAWLTVTDSNLKEAVSAACAKYRVEEAEYRRAHAEYEAARGDTAKRLLLYATDDASTPAPSPPREHDLSDIARWVVAHRDAIELEVGEYGAGPTWLQLAQECAPWSLAFHLERLAEGRPNEEGRLRETIVQVLSGTIPEALQVLHREEQWKWRFRRVDPEVHGDAVLEPGAEEEEGEDERKPVASAPKRRADPDPRKQRQDILAFVQRYQKRNKDRGPSQRGIVDAVHRAPGAVAEDLREMVVGGELRRWSMGKGKQFEFTDPLL